MFWFARPVTTLSQSVTINQRKPYQLTKKHISENTPTGFVFAEFFIGFSGARGRI